MSSETVSFAQEKSIFKSLTGGIFSFLIVTSGIVIGSTTAFSNIPNPADLLSLNTRINPDYDPTGIKIADFRLGVAIDTDIVYDDNIYATDSNKESDTIYTVRPSIYIQSDWIRHAVSANATLKRGFYHENTSENFADYQAFIKGRIDVSGNTSLPLEISYERNHIGRDSAEDRTGKEPSVYELWTGTSGLIHEGGSFALKILATIRNYAFDKVETTPGIFLHDDRNRQEYSTYTSIGTREDARFSPFIYAGFTNILYNNSLDRNGENRDSKEYEAGTGAIVNLSDITRASFNLGYVSRDLQDPSLRDINDYSYDVNIRWEPSTLLSLTLRGRRTLEESILAGASAYILSRIDISAKYELFPNVFIDPSVSYSISEYEGIDKELQRFSVGMETTYKMSRNLWLLGRYQHTTQNDKASVRSPDDFSNNIYNLSLRMHF